MTKEEREKLIAMFKDGVEAEKITLDGLQKLINSSSDNEEATKYKEKQVELEQKIETLEGQIKLLAENKDKKMLPNEEDKSFGFKSLGEFISSSLGYLSKQGIPDPRFAKIEEYQKAAGTGPVISDSTYGAILIPPAFGEMIMTETMEKANIWARGSAVPMSSYSIEFPVPEDWDHSSGTYYGGIYASFTAENTAITETRPRFGSVKLTLNEAKAMTAPSNSILRYSPISLESTLRSMFSDALSALLTDKIINGLGAGEPMGMLNAPCKIEISKETGQDADTIVLDNCLNMLQRFPANSRRRSMWIVNNDCEPQLRKMHQVVGLSGVPVYQFAAGNQQFDTLFNIPVVLTEFAQKVGDAGDIILVDPTAYFTAYFTGGMTWDTSTHVYFAYDQTAFRLVYPCDAQPKHRSALTPRYSSVTLSPVITLAERA